MFKLIYELDFALLEDVADLLALILVKIGKPDKRSSQKVNPLLRVK